MTFEHWTPEDWSPDTTTLDRALSRGKLEVPGTIELREMYYIALMPPKNRAYAPANWMEDPVYNERVECLTWATGLQVEWSEREPNAQMLYDFARLAKETAQDILAFAKRWGR